VDAARVAIIAAEGTKQQPLIHADERESETNKAGA
jgi:hypothetical protein